MTLLKVKKNLLKMVKTRYDFIPCLEIPGEAEAAAAPEVIDEEEGEILEANVEEAISSSQGKTHIT